MDLEFEFMGFYFSSLVPRFLLCAAIWYPLYRLFGSLCLERWIYFPTLFHLSLFLLLIVAATLIPL